MELDLYSTIEYTPGWYYSKFPGFWNVDCYRILSDYSHHPENYSLPESPELTEMVSDADVTILPEMEEPTNEPVNDVEVKKRKLEDG